MIWVVGIALITGFGLFTWRFVRLDLSARLAIAFAAGCVVLATVMFVFSVVHVPFNRWTLLIAMILFAAMAPLTRRGACPEQHRRTPPSPRFAGRGVLIAILAITAYGLLTARETCGDLIYFWGPKGQRFFLAGTIDAAFLAFPHYQLMHPDYPPLLPLVYAFASAVAGGFSWWGALFTTMILLAATAFAFRGLAAEAIGDERAAAYAMLLAALLAYGYARSMVGGAGEPMLLLFETIAVAALTFRDDAEAIAAIALAGAAWTKIEGAAFVVIVVIAYVITRRRVARAIAMAAPAAILVGAWILFAKSHHFLDQYARIEQRLRPESFGLIMKTLTRQAGYGASYLPWLAGAVPFVFARNWRRAALPLLVFAGLVASTIYYYLHGFAPMWWIIASAERVLLSSLMALLVAAAAASE